MIAYQTKHLQMWLRKKLFLIQRSRQ